MDKAGKNKWVDDVLDSMAGSERAMPDEGMFILVEKKIYKTVPGGRVIPINLVSAAAACILLLIAINIYTATSNMHQHIERTSDDLVTELVKYYDITNDKDIDGL